MFSALDRSDLDENSQRRVMGLVRDYILQIPREAGYAAWKAGDLLGDEWLDIETRKILMELAFAAKYRAGRKAALHGIEEALERDAETYRDELMRVLREVAKNDRSNMVRGYAQYALRRASRQVGLPADPDSKTNRVPSTSWAPTSNQQGRALPPDS